MTGPDDVRGTFGAATPVQSIVANVSCWARTGLLAGQQEAAMPCVQTIGLTEAEIDRPLYRIYPIWFLEAAFTLNGGNLALVAPHVWEDPFEDPCHAMMMLAPETLEENAPFVQKSLSDYLQPTYAQCWSFEGESDMLLRAYSRVTKDPTLGRNTELRLEGARVRSSIRSIIGALEKFAEKRADTFEFYVAKVEYSATPLQPIVNRLAEIGPTRLGKGFDRARSLTFKRTAFSHEQEVRLIAIANHGNTGNVIYVDADVNSVFTEIVFDPRLLSFERLERESRMKSLGFQGRFGHDVSYMKAVFQVALPRHWDAIEREAEIRS